MMLPETVKVGHLLIKVIPIDQREADSIGADGLFSYRHAVMRINIEQHPSQLVETFLHECLHAIWAVAAFCSKDDEEDIVTRLSPLLLTLFVDNPEIFDLIDRHLYQD
jgi:hypothetical protein